MDEALTHLGLLDDEAIEIDAAALEIAAVDHPGTPLQPYADLLGEVADRLVSEATTADGAGEQAAALARVVGGAFGFAGDRDSYDDPANADLIRVIDRRRGLPVALSILYVAAARRIGWSADALNTPGHVLVRVGAGVDPVLLDPFNDGALVGAGALVSLLTRMLGSGAKPGPEHLSPMSNRAILVRLLMNQATRAEGAGDQARALTLYRRMTLIAPQAGHCWWERARLELVAGEVGTARASLSAMLEVTREPERRQLIFAALDALSGSAP